MNSGSIPDSFRPQLHLSHLTHADRGEYSCVARNSLGTDRSSPFLLNVTCESAWGGAFSITAAMMASVPTIDCI